MKNSKLKTPNSEQSSTYVAIMAGGVGSRFWPASREERPKQFLDILGVGKSLIRLTFERFLKLVPAERIFIVTNEKYKDLVKAHLPEIEDNQILCEPSRNNTGPCIAYTAFKLQQLDSDANFVVAPSDHIILKEETFLKNIQTALQFTAEKAALCTLGISPTRPDTGYGYIKYATEDSYSSGDKKSEVYRVLEFKEKPDETTAKQYLNSGDYLWNAGIFIWKAKDVLAAFKRHTTGIYDILERGKSAYNTSAEQAFVDENYPKTTRISVDHAIMETADNVYTIPADIGWSDLGTWASLYAESEKDENGNVLQAKNIQMEAVRNCLIRAPKDKRLVLRGLDDLIIVDEGDVLLIYPKSKEQDIKKVVEGNS